MSISGLDSPELDNAWRAAIASTEPTAWALLHYASREELALFGHGSGDFCKFHTAIAAYDDKSPLYSFLCHRQRKYVIRYIPIGTSRLLQARTAVHLQSVTDRFAPDEFPITINDVNALSEETLGGQPRASGNLQNHDNLLTQGSDGLNKGESVVQSSNPEVSDILLRLKAIKERGSRSITPDTNRRPTSGPILTMHEQNDRGVPLHSEENLSMHRSSMSRGSVEGLQAERTTSIVEDWQAHEPFDDPSVHTWKPKVRHFARPITDDRAKKSQTAAGVRQRLPSGLHIGAKTSRASSETYTAVPGTHPTYSRALSHQALPTTSAITIGPASHANSLSNERSGQDLRYHTHADIPNNVSHSARLHRELPVRAPIPQVYDQPRTAPPQPLTLERQRLMKALAMRNKRLGLAAGSQADSDEVHEPSSSGRHSNADSAVEVDYYEGSDSEGEVPNISNSRLRRGGYKQDLPPLAIPSSRRQCKQDHSSYRLRRVTSGKYKPSKGNGVHPETHSVRGQSTADQERGFDDTGYESSSSSDALIEELQAAVVEEARRISLPSSPAIRTGSADDGTPSPYSITSVVILPGSNHSRASSANSQRFATRSPTLKSAAATGSFVTQPEDGLDVYSRNFPAAVLDHTSGAQAVQVIKSNPIPDSLVLRGMSGQQLREVAYQPPRVDTFARISTLEDPGYTSILASSSAEKFGALDEGLRQPPPNPTLHEQQSERSLSAQCPTGGRGKAWRPLSLNMGTTISGRPLSSAPSRRSMDLGMMFGRNSSDPKRLESAGTNLKPIEIAETRSTRTARIMKRLSSGFSSTSRQPLAQVQEQPTMETKSADVGMIDSPPPIPAAIGELNVQFPDSLLWKRRWVEADAHGNLVIGATKVNERATNSPKKYPFSAFKAPLIPSHDRQEMPCSVLLDFVHGGTLQFACDDSACQTQVMTWLSNVYSHCVM